MSTFTASRLTGGNRIFPTKVIIESNVTIQDPSLFGGKENTIPFSKIASVNIDCPFIGFSSITIETTGEKSFTLLGFTNAEVKEMKRTILDKI